ncbi:hypothetical protein A2W54_04170 [Candidatus Giovannonibacteria bacterium RIFCSPHIGHO2_02_43_13]|uniref:Glycerol-3-phosphate dehydrogenase n=1 Tax=Candidatus Giovannonibacteria bacterium RIFCSPHIGHO2_02_43_13 TaxID=1798330 RepID=A0A1F5WT21_9BACT|nr:MAG: hypothetical protein A2W54_04170 [Candidatus Giovannonibacteria bacterium RIFCSPHIGHO2_02_43_13]
MKVFVDDAGEMGTSAGVVAALAGHEVTLRFRKYSQEQADLFNNLKNGVQRSNYLHLPDIELPESIRFADAFAPAEKTNAIILAVPTKFLEKAYSEIEPYIAWNPKCTLVLLSKGFASGSGMSWGVKIKNSLMLAGRRNFAVLSGYTPAKELASAHLTKKYFAASVASRDLNAIKKVRALFRNTHLGIVGTTDIRGVSIAGALKNAYAVGYGILLGLNENSLAWKYLEIAHKEMKVFLDNVGANPKTWSSPAVRGDFYGTCQGEIAWESRNISFGKFLAAYPSWFEINKHISENMVEGYESLKILWRIAHENKLRAPLLYCIHRICFYGASPIAIADCFKA